MKYLFTLITILLVSCTSLTKKECETTDWRARGEADALSGIGISNFTRYQKECLENGINLQRNLYVEGHQKGLREFCSYQSGYNSGKNNSSSLDECDKVSDQFRKGYEEGLAFHKKMQDEQASDRKKAIDTIIESHNSETCTSNSDCRKDGECSFDKCRHNGSDCSWNSDCKIEGSCTNVSTYVPSINQSVSADVCKYP